MNREVHVRFWESAGLQCLAPLATDAKGFALVLPQIITEKNGGSS